MSRVETLQALYGYNRSEVASLLIGFDHSPGDLDLLGFLQPLGG